MSSVFDTLNVAKENNCVIEVSIQESSGSLVGRVQSFSEDYLLLESISSQGFNDGFIVIRTHEIYCIDFETNYSKKISQLYNLKFQKHDLVPVVSDNFFLNLMQFAKNNNLVAEFDYFNDVESYYGQGFVLDISSFVSIKSIDDFGKVNGTKFLKIENIKHLYCNGCHADNIKLLYENNIKG